jgi:hypothetical protein
MTVTVVPLSCNHFQVLDLLMHFITVHFECQYLIMMMTMIMRLMTVTSYMFDERVTAP